MVVLNIGSLESDLVLASKYVEEIIADGGGSAEIQDWLAGYFSKFTDNLVTCMQIVKIST